MAWLDLTNDEADRLLANLTELSRATPTIERRYDVAREESLAHPGNAEYLARYTTARAALVNHRDQMLLRHGELLAGNIQQPAVLYLPKEPTD
jgi:hypothetical protein